MFLEIYLPAQFSTNLANQLIKIFRSTGCLKRGVLEQVWKVDLQEQNWDHPKL